MKTKVDLLGANQAQITHGQSRYLQSYDVIVAAYIDNVLHLDDDYQNYSRTTSKHIAQWTGLSSNDRQKGIANGTIKLTNLNE